MHGQEQTRFTSNCLQKQQEGCCHAHLRLAALGCAPSFSSALVAATALLSLSLLLFSLSSLSHLSLFFYCRENYFSICHKGSSLERKGSVFWKHFN